MAFKTKIDISSLNEMSYKDYAALLKKEIARAKKIGRTDIVVCSDFEFSCGTTAALLILSDFTGPIAKYYRQLKTDRKSKNDFAKGSCLLEPQDDGTTALHIAIDNGKGKPAKIAKNGKRLFSRLNLSPNIFKGNLPEVGTKATLSKTQVETIETTVDKENEDVGIREIAKTYQDAYQMVGSTIVPIFQQKNWSSITKEHYDIANTAYTSAKSFLDKFKEVEKSVQATFEQFKLKVDKNLPQLEKILAKVQEVIKQQSQVEGSDQNVEGTLKEVQTVMTRIREKYQKAMNLLAQLPKK